MHYKACIIVQNNDDFLFQYGSLAGPFAPVVDGSYLQNAVAPDAPRPVLLELPRDIRDPNVYTQTVPMKVDMIAGVTQDEGAYLVGMIGHMICYYHNSTYIVFFLKTMHLWLFNQNGLILQMK